MRQAPPPEIRRRKTRKVRKPLDLPPDLWVRMTRAAAFHSKAFELTGKPESISRNEWAEDALVWALAAYWQDKGGEPANEADFEEKAAAYAQRIIEKERKAEKAEREAEKPGT